MFAVLAKLMDKSGGASRDYTNFVQILERKYSSLPSSTVSVMRTNSNETFFSVISVNARICDEIMHLAEDFFTDSPANVELEIVRCPHF